MAMKSKWADIEDDDHRIPMPMTTNRRWADVDDDDEHDQHKRTVFSEADGKGIRTEVEYTERNGKAVKLVTTYKQKKVTKKSNEHVDRRKKWAPFGNCTDPTKYSDYGGNKPVRAEEEVKIELNKEKQLKAIGQDEKFWEQSVVLCETILNDAKKKKYDANEMRRKREIEFQAQQAEQKAGIVATGGQNSTLAGKYMPPSLRKAEGGPQQDNRNENTLRVMNLSEDTREGDLQQLFGRCGPVTRVFMPRHKEGDPKEGQHKGFAFIQFRERKDGERAIKQLNGHGYDSLILQVSWAQPKAN
ncbi:unnamed protein product [Amoebophrya sp. A25]|nr:unnamed protein product [Amoebophrya sp. A25]|eukprot:GSA25T00000385001.1